MKVVLDTSVVIEYLRLKDKEVTELIRVRAECDVVLPLVVVAELYSGKSAYTKAGRLVLEDVMIGCEIGRVDVDQARRAGELRMRYGLSLGDAFVAAQALELNLPLVTSDKKAFSRVPGLKFYSGEYGR